MILLLLIVVVVLVVDAIVVTLGYVRHRRCCRRPYCCNVRKELEGKIDGKSGEKVMREFGKNNAALSISNRERRKKKYKTRGIVMIKYGRKSRSHEE